MLRQNPLCKPHLFYQEQSYKTLITHYQVQNQLNRPIRFEWPFLMQARRDLSQIRLAKIYQKRPKYYFFQKKPKRRQFSTHEKRKSGNQPLGADHYFLKYNPCTIFFNFNGVRFVSLFFPMRDLFAPNPHPPPPHHFWSAPYSMDLFPNEQNFDLDKSRKTFHHSLKEHHKISNIPKFLCEMLQNADNIVLQSLPFFSHFVLRTRN